MLALDLDAGRAEAVAAAHGAGKARAGAVDATDPAALAAALAGVAVLNAASPRHQPRRDGGGAQGRLPCSTLAASTTSPPSSSRATPPSPPPTASPSSGPAGPGQDQPDGAARGAELDRVAEVRSPRPGWTRTRRRARASPTRWPPWSTRSRWRRWSCAAARPSPSSRLSDGGEIDFPDPIGRRPSIRTLHSEVLTLPGSLGAREADFRLSLGPGVLDRLLELRESSPRSSRRCGRRRRRPGPGRPSTCSCAARPRRSS